VDTRSKILSIEAAGRLPGPLTLASGYFDVLRVEHARELAALPRPLLVAVVERVGVVLNAAARAEMVAALRAVDYVVIADYAEVSELIERIRPREVARMETADQGRTAGLIHEVQRSVKGR
jgi:glycerol-3-phosphate cytidylyltransferase-like family protein